MSNPKPGRWLVKGALGCILVGTGFCLAVEASHWKHRGDAFWIWAGAGTVGLSILIAGIITLINNKKS
ncbi:MAG: hypothetical protein AAGH46_12345 [Bacteroidota bacterium]